MAATVNAKTVRATLGAAKALGLDAASLAAARGLADALTDVDARFPHAAWLGLWEDVIAGTGRESVGIEAAARLPWGHWDVIDYLLGTSDDLGAALRRFTRFFAVISTGVTHTLEEHGDAVHLVRRYAPGCQTRLLAPTEFAFANVVIRVRAAVASTWAPRAVVFAAPAPTSDAAHRELFRCPVEFDAATSAIIFDAAGLALPMKQPDPELVRILERHADQIVGQLGADHDIVARVRRVIVHGLPDADVTLARTARQLGMSARSLQRRLDESDQTFDGLYDRTRQELARGYLRDPALSIQETAHLLAFADLRGFYRAFRRWEGCTPAEFRKRGAPGP